MKKLFLKARHWQLFLLMFGIPMIFQFIIMGTVISASAGGSIPSEDFLPNFKEIFSLMMLIFTVTYFGWFWSIATGLQNILPDEVYMNLNRFKVLLFIPIATILFLMVDSILSFGFIESNFITSLVSIFSLQLLSMFCMLHSFYFVAKTIKAAELQRNVTFGDFAGEFFMLWFYPIGVWILQPKINKMIAEKQ